MSIHVDSSIWEDLGIVKPLTEWNRFIQNDPYDSSKDPLPFSLEGYQKRIKKVSLIS